MVALPTIRWLWRKTAMGRPRPLGRQDSTAGAHPIAVLGRLTVGDGPLSCHTEPSDGRLRTARSRHRRTSAMDDSIECFGSLWMPRLEAGESLWSSIAAAPAMAGCRTPHAD